MKKPGKIIGMLSLFVLCLSLLVVPAYAGKTTFSAATVKNGSTTRWHPTNNTNGWSISNGISATLYFAMGSAEKNVKGGIYRPDNNTNYQACSGSGSTTMKGSKKSPASTRYKAYFTNNAASSVSVKNTSYISF